MTRPDGRARLHVVVEDAAGKPILDATLTLALVNAGSAISLAYDAKLAGYVAEGLPTGTGTLSLRRHGFRDQDLALRTEPGPNRQLFVMAETGRRCYFRGRSLMPVDADEDLIGLQIYPEAPGAIAELQSLVSALGLTPLDVSALSFDSGLRLFKAPSGTSAAALKRLSSSSAVEFAGAVVSQRKKAFTFLTKDVIVRFRKANAAQARTIATQMGYELLREVSYSPATYVFRWNEPASMLELDSIERLAALDNVDWAEPSLVATPGLDQVTPNDTLWPGLWDRQLVGVQNAWQALQAKGLPTYGDPNVVLAIWDSGVQSANGSPTNADFSGVVSDGSPKVAVSYDFVHMVANNDTPWEDHGSAVASVAAALADNISQIAGQAYGTVGSAPNVRIMTIMSRKRGSDLEAADQFVWMAGFDPGVTGYPSPPPKAADIINCCLILSENVYPLSAIAQAALDFVTTFGRGGLGTLCFFSSGSLLQDNRKSRPWSAYEKSFGIAASTRRAGIECLSPNSGVGQIELSGPSDNGGAIHDPPLKLMTWAACEPKFANLIGFQTSSTKLSNPAQASAVSLAVDNVAGFAVGGIIHVGLIGAPGSEPACINAIDLQGSTLGVSGFDGAGFNGGLVNAHAAGVPIATGPALHRNNFGGTSSATPLCSGVAALVLSANPTLNFIQAREILRQTAQKIDFGNADPLGQWLDAAGNPAGKPEDAVWSGWYGHGRVDAGAAVDSVLKFESTSDLVVRKNLADPGVVPAAGSFANSPDVWCRVTAPASDPGALPINYMNAGPHEDPVRGVSNWVYVRVHNAGTAPSPDGWVRVSVSHFPGLEFTYPDSFLPSNGPDLILPSPLVPGTYLIGEAKVRGVAPGGEQIVTLEWPAELIPPATVTTSAGVAQWHPCLLVEVTPHEQPVPPGSHVWDDNNLAQKNISIVSTSVGAEFAVGAVVGDENNQAPFVLLEVLRGRLPQQVKLSLDLADPAPGKSFSRRDEGVKQLLGARMSRLLDRVKESLQRWLPSTTARGWRVVRCGRRQVALLAPFSTVQLPLHGGPGALSLIIVRGVVGRGAPVGEYQVELLQRQPMGSVSGGMALTVTIR